MSGPRVFVTRRLPGNALERLAAVTDLDCWQGDANPPHGELIERARHAEGIVPIIGDPIDAGLVEACERLRVVAGVGVGYDHVDVAALTRAGIPFSNTPGVLTEATADLAFALLLAVARRLVEARAVVLEGQWKAWDPSFLLGKELAGSTIGIVGVGRIGEAMARRARGFGMEVLGWSRSARELDGVSFVSLPELLERSEFVSLHVALTPETHHLIGVDELAAMRSDAVLINTARGQVVDQSALYAALRDGVIAGAGLDVAEVEPMPMDDPLLELANCLVLPHVASATVATRSAMANLAVDNLLAGLRGEPLPNCVNPEVYGPR
ncbi:MAG: D-glycerate dehydrogenase [Acidimicrobiaceae bacterium]|nr:D-glycerate dehydrogenase [Acidimicrobiaceae bacterium]